MFLQSKSLRFCSLYPVLSLNIHWIPFVYREWFWELRTQAKRQKDFCLNGTTCQNGERILEMNKNYEENDERDWCGLSIIESQWFSNVSVHENHLGTMLNYRFEFSRSLVDHEILSLQQIPRWWPGCFGWAEKTLQFKVIFFSGIYGICIRSQSG